MPAEDGPERFEGSDDTGAVTVVVDGRGLVTDVVSAARWQDEVHPRELGPALCAAANEALAGRMADEFEHGELESAFRPVTRQDAREAGGDPTGEIARNLQAEVAELLVAFDREVVTYRRELRAEADATASARSRKGAVEITVGHGRVITVTVDPSWAKTATHTAVRAEALGAFTAAGEQLGAPSTVTPPTAIARLARLAADPPALFRELGLQ
jgi:DNA-binding protein YbaB